MVEVRWTLQASEDLDSIAEFISKDSPHYASLFVLDVYQTVDRISEFPESGRVVPESNEPVIREIILGNYRVVYRLKDEAAYLVTIFHGARLLDPSRLKE